MRKQSGDTLIEVLIAVAILAAAVVGGLGIMNYGFGIILNSIERTQVQAEVSSQLSMIQYARDEYVRAGKIGTAPGGPAAWQAILDNTSPTYSDAICTNSGNPSTNPGRRPFHIRYTDTQTIAYVAGVPTTPTKSATAGDGLWVEAVRQPNTNYIDFYVKACWTPATGTVIQESKSTMRLYTAEPIASIIEQPVIGPLSRRHVS